jgi:undecaprenyl-diphosphatase
MTLFEALALGLVQGITEFLPVSSSGHLALGKHLLGVQEPDLLFDLVLHVGTLASVLIFYRADIIGVVQGVVEGIRRMIAGRCGPTDPPLPEGMRLAALVLLATLPTGILGLLLKRVLEPDQGSSPITVPIICAILIFNGFLLMSNRFVPAYQAKHPPAVREGGWALWNMRWVQALVIGVGQGVAVLPGLSRSGTTITLALWLGVERANAARYSFLLSIPAISGAVLLKLKDVSEGTSAFEPVPFLSGAVLAGVVGYGCLVLLTRLLARAQFHHFSWYCWAVGILGLVATLAGG